MEPLEFTKYVLYAIGALVLLLTIAPLFRFSSWWVRVGEFPRSQIAVLGLSVIVLLVILGWPLGFFDLTAAALLSVAVIYQIHAILPHTFLYPKQVLDAVERDPSRTIKLLISNVLVENEDAAGLLRIVEAEDPDLVLLAEPDERWIRDVAPLRDKYEHVVEEPQDNAYGMALYSRFELVEPEVKFIVEEDTPSIHARVRLPSGELIRFFGVHPKPPVPSETGESTERDAELILVGKRIDEESLPSIIAGDMNDVAWSRTTLLFQKVSGMLDPRIGRGMFNSFHADYPFVRFPLDHVFHSNHFKLVELRRLPDIGSDHFPILAVLSLENGAELEQEEPKAESGEVLEANSKVREAERKKMKKLDPEKNVNDD
ncbi:MAG: endonuclease [Acidobacteria bacterium]|nr:MAG: endonuclease [Acidobacteriota bacterium]REJ98212.1 MAG: endonuclease [Acidobacteriota bacterium]REK16956.1 MAG: endonuclease [Acidobacteriota bacterium]REK42866.1 MAG: endonuclease [Acidobacteriota bacterium]